MSFTIPNGAIIKKIEEHYELNKDNLENYLGLKIETTKGNVLLVIEDHQYCCEDWGGNFFDTPDNINYFIGSKILSIEEISIDIDQDNSTQLRITTDKGILQYAVYNSHNGYYEHTAILQVFDETFTNYL